MWIMQPKGSPCVVEGCDKPITRPTQGWCEMHYMRHRRHGDVNATYPGAQRLGTNGYRRTPVVNGVQDYEHRVVLLAKIGPGEHPCHWCGKTLFWDADRYDPSRLEVDHLDGDKLNNDPGNLAPSCHHCNAGRASRREECKRGHRLEGNNPRIRRNGSRECRICRNLLRRLRRQERATA